MAGLNGADADELERFGQQLRTAAERLEAIRGEVGSAFGRANWEGDDAQHFHDLWSHQLSGRLHAASAATRDAATVVVRNAQQQRQASSTDGGGSGGSGGGRPYYGDPGGVTPWNPLTALENWVGGGLGVAGVLGDVLERRGVGGKLVRGLGRLGLVGDVIEGARIGIDLGSGDPRTVKVAAVDLASDATFKLLEGGALMVFPPAALGVAALEIGYSFVPEDAKVAAADAVIDAGKHVVHAAQDVGHAVGEVGHAVGDVGQALGGLASGGFNNLKKTLHW